MNRQGRVYRPIWSEFAHETIRVRSMRRTPLFVAMTCAVAACTAFAAPEPAYIVVGGQVLSPGTYEPPNDSATSHRAATPRTLSAGSTGLQRANVILSIDIESPLAAALSTSPPSASALEVVLPEGSAGARVRGAGRKGRSL